MIRGVGNPKAEIQETQAVAQSALVPMQYRDSWLNGPINSMTVRFTATIKIRGINPYVLVSASRAKAIKAGWRKPLPVLVRVNGKPAKAWRINMMPVGNGSFYLYLHGEIRKASGTAVGDRVEIAIEFDASYRGGPQGPMPTWFKKALAANPVAEKNWEMLTPSRQKEIVRYLSNLKSPDARARNLARALGVLSGDKERFMARSWKDGA